MEFSNQIKERVVYLYTKSRMSVSQISKAVTPNGELSLDDVVNILEMYQKESGKKLVREKYNFGKESFKYRSEISNEVIEKLVNNGYSDREIAKYFVSKGYKITPQAIYNRKKKIYIEKGLPIPSIDKKSSQQKYFKLKDEKDFDDR